MIDIQSVYAFAAVYCVKYYLNHVHVWKQL